MLFVVALGVGVGMGVALVEQMVKRVVTKETKERDGYWGEREGGEGGWKGLDK